MQIKMEHDYPIDDENVWRVIEKFFDHQGFLNHQIESYNDFIMNSIPSIIQNNRFIEVVVEDQSYLVEFGEDMHFDVPVYTDVDKVKEITPKECVDRGITYASNLFIDVTCTNHTGYTRVHKNVHFGAIPTMVMSKLCNISEVACEPNEMARLKEDIYEKGGYFIVKGVEKAITPQERTAFDKPYVFKNRKRAPKYNFYCEVRSNSVSGVHSTTTQVGHLNGLITVVVPYIEMEPIPLGVIFRALGAKDEKEMVKYITHGDDEDLEILNFLSLSLEHSFPCDTQDKALYFIGKRGKKFSGGEGDGSSTMKQNAISYARHLLLTEFLPHLGGDFLTKKYYIGYMTRKLIDVCLGRKDLDDRDNYKNKLIATVGNLFSSLFSGAFKRIRNEIIGSIEKCISGKNAPNIIASIKPVILTSTFTNALTTNTWSGRTKIQGISQTYNRFNISAKFSNLRKQATPMSSEGAKVELPRELHSTHWGTSCPADTPEGKTCGLIKTQAVQCIITTGSDPIPLIQIMCSWEQILPFNIIEKDINYLTLCKIFVNGKPIGLTAFPGDVVSKIREKRRGGCLDFETSVYFDINNNEILISTSPWRLCRPLLIVKNGRAVLRRRHIQEIEKGDWDVGPGNAWTRLLEGGYIELIDKTEEDSAYIAMYPSDLETSSGEIIDKDNGHKFTHCEMHPSLILGFGSSLIPYPDHNQCIFENELVTLSNGTRIPIKDVVPGDSVVTFDPKTMSHSYTEITHVYSGVTEKKVYQATTYGNRRITATFDHRFMTSHGWLTLEDIPVVNMKDVCDTTPLISISLEQTPYPLCDSMSEQIVSVEKYISSCNKHDISDVGIQLFELRGVGLLPLNDDKAGVLARICGYVWGENNISVVQGKCVGSVGYKYNSTRNSLITDLHQLGFRGEIGSFGDITLDEEVRGRLELPELVISFLLSVDIDSHTIPDWILDGRERIKREFLAGYQGRFGHPVSWERGTEGLVFNIPLTYIPETYHQKEIISQFVQLFNDLDINSLSSGCGYQISCDNLSNISKYYGLVGYRYNVHVNSTSGVIVEYIEYFSTIASSHLHYYQTIEWWLNVVTISQSKTSINLPLFKKEVSDEVNISDITTKSTNQSFLCGDGFCVHNSPRNTYQCLWEEENVLMANGKLVKMKDIMIGDEVKSFNPETLELVVSKVTHVMLTPTTKPMLLIKSFNKQIAVTGDHPMMTQRGWVQARFLSECDRIATYNHNKLTLSHITSVKRWREGEIVNIGDITVDSGYHSFIGGNGFGVHNSSMGKQAIGVPGTNYLFAKNKTYVLNNPQAPLVSTKMMKIMSYPSTPTGQNAIIAICPYKGFNEEDSIVINADSIDRGFLNITCYIPFEGRVRKEQNECFEIPTECDCSNYKGNSEKLDPETGIITEGQEVEKGDILIGRTSIINTDQTVHKQNKKSISILYDQIKPGKVYSVQVGIDGQGYKYVRVVICQLLAIDEGDKFSSTSAQKGTCGRRVKAIDLMRTETGVVPDILINPHAFPSRMTIGMLIEMLVGKKIASTHYLNQIHVSKVFALDRPDGDPSNGEDETFQTTPIKYSWSKENGDATPFNKSYSLERICNDLKSLGLNGFGDENMYNGETGELIPSMICMGVCFYQRLYHLVSNKVHARSRGGKTGLMRQPKEGRRLCGGHKLGTMEVECVTAQGASGFIKDRLMEQSDETHVLYCRLCGLQATAKASLDGTKITQKHVECQVCQGSDVSLVKLPYATKLLTQILASMNVVQRVITRPFE